MLRTSRPRRTSRAPSRLRTSPTGPLAAAALAAALGACASAPAPPPMPTEEKIAKVVFQVTTDDPGLQSMALSNIVNIQQSYGIDNVEIEVVAYGPGLSLLTDDTGLGARVTSLTYQEVRFTACNNTMKTILEQTGFAPRLVEGVTVVPAGVRRIIELQQQGYAYVRP